MFLVLVFLLLQIITINSLLEVTFQELLVMNVQLVGLDFIVMNLVLLTTRHQTATTTISCHPVPDMECATTTSMEQENAIVTNGLVPVIALNHVLLLTVQVEEGSVLTALLET